MVSRSEGASTFGTKHGEMYRGGRIGKYEILTQLSLGGMAELFLAFTAGPGGFQKFVVIKRILPDAQSNENFVKMFLDEARITALLNHPNIAQVYDLEDEGSGPFIAMEFIPGQNLNQIMKESLARKTTVPLGFSVAVTRDICLALHHAHTFTDSSGRPSPVIHRDVAQKNVMVTYAGTVKLLDFGIAKVRGSLGRTTAGMVKGTTGYMSPEQVRGESLDGRSDVFTAGVMLHELLTGRRLFAAATETEEMEKILFSAIPRPSQLQPLVPEPLSQVVMAALARDRADRLPTAKAMAKALEDASWKMMFDADRMSVLMRELFQSKMTATQTLLESASGGDNAGTASARAALSGDAGMTFPERPSADVPAAIRQPVELYSADVERAAAPRKPPFNIGKVALVGAASIALSALTLWRTGQFAATRAKTAIHRVSTFGSLDPPPEEVELHDGTLTLISRPNAEVWDRDQVLGRTPLINVRLPEGPHRLRLVGPDGARYTLDISLAAGRAEQLQVTLEDLALEK